ncbi:MULTISPECIES: hypothetical protein [Salimicrobium]|uniref:Uncharacterized protein n=1 Tax=Salimicrobium humidisoli TaxID=2029857 RepID=A0ABX4HNS0_9BACI|nr:MULTISPECIES: hypothetical protein [Salimicrobium]PBB04836.1 hypothetical protein CKW00_11860 [Salimicrobium humidisoli]
MEEPDIKIAKNNHSGERVLEKVNYPTYLEENKGGEIGFVNTMKRDRFFDLSMDDIDLKT